ncbi:MAG: U32 family peptidase C-terminal domain-containing protein, partial [Clostridia bacterium]|nr:U32 family peptidase C-terminal domain-containing protein [Clostridia bacterium]
SQDFRPSQWIVDELKKISYRDYCTGFYFDSPQNEANVSFKGGYNREWSVAAIAEKTENGRLYATQRNRFFEGDIIEVMEKGVEPFEIRVTDLRNEEGESIDNAPHPTMKLSFACERTVSPGSYLRIKSNE